MRLRRPGYFFLAQKVTKNAFRADFRGTVSQGRCGKLEISVYYSTTQDEHVVRFAFIAFKEELRVLSYSQKYAVEHFNPERHPTTWYLNSARGTLCSPS